MPQHSQDGGYPTTIVEQGSSLGHWFIGKDKLSPALKKRLVEELNLNAAYTNCSATGLHSALCLGTLLRMYCSFGKGQRNG